MATDPNFFTTPRWQFARLSTGDTALQGPSDDVAIWSGLSGANYVDRIHVKGTDATTAGMIRLWLFDGSNYYLWKEIDVQAITPSATVKAWEYQLILDPPLILDASTDIYATTENTEDFDVMVGGGE